MRDLLDSLRLTGRSLARQPGLVAVVVLTLGLGIGASTALFDYLSAIAWPHFQAPHLERTFWVFCGTDEAPQSSSSYEEFDYLAHQPGTVRDLVAFSTFAASVTHGEASHFAWGYVATGGYFPFFAARPALGRLLEPADDRPGAPPVVVAGHTFWRGALGGDPGVVGKTLRLNGQLFTLVGVTAAGFTAHGHTNSLYVPMVHADSVIGAARLADRERRWLNFLGRLPAGVSEEAGEAALAAHARALDEASPLGGGHRRRISLNIVTVYAPGTSDPFFVAARLLLAAAILLLLLGSANAANLLLARAVTRAPEQGLRAALGASRARLAGRALGESLLLALAGGALGLAFAAVLEHRLDRHLGIMPVGYGNWSEGNRLLRIDGGTVAFAAGVALLVTLLCGLAPALLGARRGLLAAARDRGGQGSAFSLRSRQLLVVLQVALSTLLLLNAGLLARSFAQAVGTDAGFEPGRFLLGIVYVPRNVSPDGRGDVVFPLLLDHARAIPGVEVACLVHGAPFSGPVGSIEVAADGRREARRETQASFVSSSFFETAGIPLLYGRAPDSRDRRDRPPVVVVSRALARALWGEDNAVGRRLFVDDQPEQGEPGPVFEVVGVAGDTRGTPPPAAPLPAIYFSYHQRSHARVALAVRSPVPVEHLAPALRDALRATHPDLSILEMVTGEEALERNLVNPRMHAEVGGLFGLLGLAVATAGLFGLFSYTVTLKAREIGIRLALGARPRDVVLRILAEGMVLAALGIALGTAAALGTRRFLASMLFGVGATDFATFVGVPLLLAAVALLACYVPARRAARLDPLMALREG